MINEAQGRIDYDECGSGPAVVLLPGSCSTGAAWRPVIAAWGNEFRSVTTSLLDYGGTGERRNPGDSSISRNAEAMESVIHRAGGRVHLVGHSFGGLVALAVALRNRVSLASLVVIEAPAVGVLREGKELQHYCAFNRMTDAYLTDFAGGNVEAIAAMIDFYGGAGTFASWPPRLRAYAVETTPVNILDWADAYGFPMSAALLDRIKIPLLVVRGGASPQAVQRANALVCELTSNATLATIDGATHFVIVTHAVEIAGRIAAHVHRAEEEMKSPVQGK
jgi:pimeloyl-ACP methyl ester carboxylesterase